VFAQFGGALLFVVLFMIAGPLAEEFGWRGYAQPRLRRRFGIVATSVALGLAWAVWHVPLYFLPGTGQYDTGLFTADALIFMVTCIPLSLVYLFLSERLGGRVWAAILIHFSGNAIGAFLPSESIAVSLLQLALTSALAVGVFAVWGPHRGPAIERVEARDAVESELSRR
jgi:membrane protease YdiL (CAAX protease family)